MTGKYLSLCYLWASEAHRLSLYCTLPTAIFLWAVKTWCEFLHSNIIFSSGGECLAPSRKESRLSCIMLCDTSARIARVQGSSWAGHTTPEPVHREVQGVPEYQLDCFRASPGAVPDGQQSGWLTNLAWDAAPESLIIVLPKTVLHTEAQTIGSMQRTERFININ